MPVADADADERKPRGIDPRPHEQSPKECSRVNNDGRIVNVFGPGARAETEAVEETGQASARNESIGVGSGDENVAKIQLAARWAELYAPENGDGLDDALRRFKRAYMYLDSVTKLVEPDDV
jgi:hypothetical protein